MFSTTTTERSILAGAALTLIGGLAACGSVGSAASAADSGPLPLEAAYDACNSADATGTLSLGDGGRTIIVDTGSKYGKVDGLACVMLELGTSQAVVAQMDSTTAMMGVQDAEDDGIAYKWSYHPDNGINMVITDTASA